MATIPPLFKLPRELRDNIWRLVFAMQEVVPSKIPALEQTHCLACRTEARQNTPYYDAYVPLLTCKQIDAEASYIFKSTVIPRIVTLEALRFLERHPDQTLRCVAKSVILDIHLDDDNRDEWLASMYQLPTTFPHLQKLTINNHMRAPTGYNALTDALYIAGPLVNLPAKLAYPGSTTIHVAYCTEGIMFENAFLGIVRVSDALEEHEKVILDLLIDEDFAKASKTRDLQLMTNCLLRIAGAHEQPWFEALQRRRRDALNNPTE